MIDPTNSARALLLVSADSAWSVIRQLYADDTIATPFGEAFVAGVSLDERPEALWIVQGGWGKIAAAAATQYAIDCWRPDVLVNIGTCGGFSGEAYGAGNMLYEESTIEIIEGLVGELPVWMRMALSRR